MAASIEVSRQAFDHLRAWFHSHHVFKPSASVAPLIVCRGRVLYTEEMVWPSGDAARVGATVNIRKPRRFEAS